MYENTLKRKQYKKEELETMEFKIKVIQHSKDFQIKSAMDAFSLSRRTICRWREILKKNNNIYDLIPISTKPKNFRESKIPQEVINFIKEKKLVYPKLGKDKIAKLIQDKLQIIISPTKVQDIVNDLKSKGILRDKVKYSLNGRTGKLHILHKQNRKIKLRRDGFKPKKKGQLVQTDTIVIHYFGRKFYLLTAIDIWNRLAFAKVYTSHSSQTAGIFLKEVINYFNYNIQRIQTDNGSEFNLNFEFICRELNIIHFYNYPRSPKSNAFVERFNRTVQEEFLEKTKSLLMRNNLTDINLHLIEYLKFYNQERPHWGLGLNTPIKYNG